MTAFQFYGLPLVFILTAVLFYQEVKNDFKTVYRYDSPSDAEILYPNETLNDFSRSNIYISIGESDHCLHYLHGWWYSPLSTKSVPIVVLSHGLGGQKDMGLASYAEAIARAGFNALVLDYRTFGGSVASKSCGISIRNHINPWNHVADIKSAVKYLKSGALGSGIDTEQIALWGTSFAGGHSIVVAAELGSAIKAVISQVPHLDGRAASKRGIAQRGFLGTIKLIVLVVTDFVRSGLGLSPLYVKIAGIAGEISYMIMETEEYENYFKKHPKSYLGNWQNLAPARTLAKMSFYNPIEHVKDVQAPILFVGAVNDTLCPIDFVKAASLKAKHTGSKLVEVGCNHFDIYLDGNAENLKREMVSFLKLHLLSK